MQPNVTTLKKLLELKEDSDITVFITARPDETAELQKTPAIINVTVTQSLYNELEGALNG